MKYKNSINEIKKEKIYHYNDINNYMQLIMIL